MNTCRTLLVGIGSPHGDDRAGWLLAERVAEKNCPTLQVRFARHPAELLDWLEGVELLLVCDAMRCDSPPGTCRVWTWPAEEIELARFSGSHDLPLAATLALAAELNRLPPRVEIWGVSIDAAQPAGEVSAAVEAAVGVIAEQISGALCHA